MGLCMGSVCRSIGALREPRWNQSGLIERNTSPCLTLPDPGLSIRSVAFIMVCSFDMPVVVSQFLMAIFAAFMAVFAFLMAMVVSYASAS